MQVQDSEKKIVKLRQIRTRVQRKAAKLQDNSSDTESYTMQNAKMIYKRKTHARTCTGRAGQQSLQSLGVYYLPVGRDLFGRL